MDLVDRVVGFRHRRESGFWCKHLVRVGSEDLQILHQDLLSRLSEHRIGDGVITSFSERGKLERNRWTIEHEDRFDTKEQELAYSLEKSHNM